MLEKNENKKKISKNSSSIKSRKSFFSKLFDFLFVVWQWNIGIIDAPIHRFLENSFEPQIKWLPEFVWDRFAADPFAIKSEDKLHILFEEYDSNLSKGHISTISLEKDTFSKVQKVIEKPFHMSYPYLLNHNGKIYCMPETYQDKKVSLYEAQDFPLKWKKVATLIDNFAGLDSSVIFYKGCWWLFATDFDYGENNNLFIWHSKDLFGPWKPHSSNPVKMDVSSSRPAGTPFVYKGELYRPAQDCSEKYGGKVVINKITKLSADKFEEEQISVVNPYKNTSYHEGLHTLSAVGDMVVIDALRKGFIFDDFSLIKYKTKSFFKRIKLFFK